MSIHLVLRNHRLPAFQHLISDFLFISILTFCTKPSTARYGEDYDANNYNYPGVLTPALPGPAAVLMSPACIAHTRIDMPNLYVRLRPQPPSSRVSRESEGPKPHTARAQKLKHTGPYRLLFTDRCPHVAVHKISSGE
ncbi:hypothetical protein J6590_085645 [Homalodisca vitripennis]|nr:hypothetical protein J6590_085645 [Homalodisca vitripennis]